MAIFLEKVEITKIGPANADSAKLRYKAEFSRDISEILPYLNRVIKTAQYNDDGEWLSYNQGISKITIYRDSLYVQKVQNETEALELNNQIKSLINDTYERKETLEPLYGLRKRPAVLEIFKYLPKTNCKICDEPTCMAFAAKLSTLTKRIESCSPLFAPDKMEELKAIRELMHS